MGYQVPHARGAGVLKVTSQERLLPHWPNDPLLKGFTDTGLSSLLQMHLGLSHKSRWGDKAALGVIPRALASRPLITYEWVPFPLL